MINSASDKSEASVAVSIHSSDARSPASGLIGAVQNAFYGPDFSPNARSTTSTPANQAIISGSNAAADEEDMATHQALLPDSDRSFMTERSAANTNAREQEEPTDHERQYAVNGSIVPSATKREMFGALKFFGSGRNRSGSVVSSTLTDGIDPSDGAVCTLQVCAHSVWESEEVSAFASELTKRMKSITRRSCCYIHEIPPPEDDDGPFGPAVECVPKTLRMSFERRSVLNRIAPHIQIKWSMLIFTFVLTAAALFALHSAEFAPTPPIVVAVVNAMAGAALLASLLHYSTAIMMRMMMSFDVWLLLLWTVILTLCDTASTDSVSSATTIGRTFLALITIACLLFTDAADVPNKRWLGLFKLGLAFGYTSMYVLWRLALEYPDKFPSIDAQRPVTMGNYFKVKIATVAQCGAATMACFALRFAYRKLFDRSDTAILQFGATTAPHHSETRSADRRVWLEKLLSVAHKSFKDKTSFNNKSNRESATVYGTTGDHLFSKNSFLEAVQQSSHSFVQPPADQPQESGLKDDESTSSTALNSIVSSYSLVRIYITLTCPVVEAQRMRNQLEREIVDLDTEPLLERNYSANQYAKLQAHRHFVPRRILVRFSPDPLIRWATAGRLVRHPYWMIVMPFLFLTSFLVITVIDFLDVTSTAANMIPRLVAIVVVMSQVLFGLSRSIIAHEIFNLEFWFLVTQLPLAIPSSWVYYHERGLELPVLVTHAAMLLCNTFLMTGVDALIIPRPRYPGHNPRKFMNRIKGITFLGFAVYAMIHIYFSQKQINDSEAFRREVDFGVAVLSMGSFSQATLFNLLVIEVRMVFQYFILQQDMVLTSFPTHEEADDGI